MDGSAVVLIDNERRVIQLQKDTLEALDGFGRNAPLRPAAQVGGDVDADQFAAAQKAVDLVRADFPTAAKVRDGVASSDRRLRSGSSGSAIRPRSR